MTCGQWIMGSCDCGQPCDQQKEVARDFSDPFKPIRDEFKALADAHYQDFPAHIVAAHFELVAGMLGVKLPTKTTSSAGEKA